MDGSEGKSRLRRESEIALGSIAIGMAVFLITLVAVFPLGDSAIDLLFDYEVLMILGAGAVAFPFVRKHIK
jgi:hypothetical protein